MIPEYNSPSWTEIFRYLYKNKVTLLGASFLVAFFTAVITLFIPNKFTSTANLLPAQRPTIGFSLFADEGGLSNLASSVLGTGVSEETNRYLVLLESYSSSKQVIDTFDLTQVYDVAESDDPIKYAIEVLSERTTFESKEEGNFIISVLDEDPVRAKNMVDYYVELLNEVNTKIVTGDARKYREFIEKRYQQALSDADSIQTKVIDFQKKHGVIELPEQVKTYFGIVGGLTAKKIESEFKIELLSETVNPNSDSYQSALTEYNSIDRALNNAYQDTNRLNIMLNFAALPEISTRYYKLVLESEIQAEIQKFLIPVYEQAKMEEAKSLPIVSIVDQPIVPIKKSEPRRSIIVIVSAISAFWLILLFLILKLSLIKNREYFSYLRS